MHEPKIENRKPISHRLADKAIDSARRCSILIRDGGKKKDADSRVKTIVIYKNRLSERK
jgi:hypothetical protein